MLHVLKLYLCSRGSQVGSWRKNQISVLNTQKPRYLDRWALAWLSQPQGVSYTPDLMGKTGSATSNVLEGSSPSFTEATKLNTRAGGNWSFPSPSLGTEVEEAWACSLLSYGVAGKAAALFPWGCASQGGWLWQHALKRPIREKEAGGGLPGWCIAMLLAAHGAIIVAYRLCRDVLSICMLYSHTLLNSHVNCSVPNGDAPPVSLLCWAA